MEHVEIQNFGREEIKFESAIGIFNLTRERERERVMICTQNIDPPIFLPFSFIYWEEEKRNNEKRGGEIIIERGKIEWAIGNHRISNR